MARRRPRPATLFGLGVGPGDPELLTLKARRLLRRVPVVAYVALDGGASLARSIVAGHLRGGQTEIALAIPLRAARRATADAYRRHAAAIAAHLEAGRDVALLCEGDPFFYGSFIHLFERLAAKHRVEVVPGVSSLTAAAAVAGRPLVARDQVLTVLPATLPLAELTARLRGSDAAAIVKVGRHLPKVRRALAGLGLIDCARYVERAGMAGQRVLAVDEVATGAAPYFSIVLVRRGRRRPPKVAAATPVADRRLPAGAALIALGPGGIEIGRRLRRVLPDSRLHGLAGRTEGADETFAEVVAHLRRLFAAGIPIVGLCAAGILIRALAPLLADKRVEAPVVAVAEDGSAAVPLLGGHRGANRMAEAIAEATGGIAAVTTGGEVRFGLAIDEPPAGWRIANPGAAKGVAAALLAGRPVALAVEAGDAGWLVASGADFGDEGERSVRVTDRAVAEPGDELVLHPPVLAVGVGCERNAAAAEVVGLVDGTLRRAGLAPAAVACVASLDVKADEAAVHAAAAALGVPARFFTAAELECETPRLANPSPAVFRAVGCHGVAEAAALAAAGRRGALVVDKTTSRRATCAVARSPADIEPLGVGRGRGRLAVVGIGPGAAEWRTPEATSALAEASDVVGYRLYLDLVADAIAGKARHQSPLGAEETRVRTALDLAAEGRTVALVSSGDAGIYALAARLFDLLEAEDRPEWNRIALRVVPGVSAMQAAAARIGAPLGHDFCAISLSDLRTPWAEIERRLQAAAAGDFVVALYNPASARRRRQLARARDILAARRPATTPVVVARNLGRAGESVEVIRLDELTARRADMLTVVLVGNGRTRVVERGAGRWVYTPNGSSGGSGRK